MGAGGGGGQEAESARPRGAEEGDPADPHPAVPQVQEQHRGELILGEPLLSALSGASHPGAPLLAFRPLTFIISCHHQLCDFQLIPKFSDFTTATTANNLVL